MRKKSASRADLKKSRPQALYLYFIIKGVVIVKYKPLLGTKGTKGVYKQGTAETFELHELFVYSKKTPLIAVQSSSHGLLM